MRILQSKRPMLRASVAMSLALSVPAFAQETTETFTPLGRIVLGAGAEKVAIDAPQSISVLEEEDIAEVQPGTIGDVLERSPGVSTVGSESRFGESFNIRGIGGGTSADEPRIVTVIDGVRKYYESYRQGSLFTDPEFFKRVEILRGPGSSTLYGAGALAGVISLETKDASDFLEPGDPFGVDQKLEYRSNGDGVETATFLAFAPDQRFDGLIGFIYDDSDFLESGDGDEIPGTRITEYNTLIKGTFSFGEAMEHEIEAAFIRYQGEADDQLLDVIDLGTSFGQVDREVIDTTAYVRYNFAPVDRDLIDLTVQLSYGKSENNITDFRVPSPPPGFTEDSVRALFDADYAYEGTGLRVENTSQILGNRFANYLTVGTDISTQDRISTRATAANAEFQPEGVTDIFGLFAQNEFIWDERFTVLTGTRIDFQETTPGDLVATDEKVEDEGISATLALHYQINDQFALFGSTSYTERLPVVDELYDARPVSLGPGVTGADQISAGSLENEESRNVELGFSYSQDAVFQTNDQIALKTVIFRNNLENLIARNDEGVAGDPVFINIDKANIQGLELEAAYESDRLFGSLAYTFLEGENESDPDGINPELENRIPANTIVLSLGTRIPAADLELGWTGTHYESKSREVSFAGAVQEVDTPSNLIHDVYAAWAPDEGQFADITVRLGVSNVADEDYRTHLQDPAVRRAGRSINLSVSRTF
ncbi:TonB-dependent receptor [Cognatiyoonia sp. IB215446]|uniref:TonB-dependent receptor domain-containing protein n=1 Tax=Cognatiyoonia sp. IB215446 TaxID=3097355 RepID=UPI002A127F8B|nr:TonB-dependent receptor [Cognatiyoonia sp. IB215446]MDX8350644.1 TonB-dependent receptor [Cognatiyoonia sp. IB215446]